MPGSRPFPPCHGPRLASLGGAEGIRTPDLLRAKQALSHLSYSPIYELARDLPAAALGLLPRLDAFHPPKLGELQGAGAVGKRLVHLH